MHGLTAEDGRVLHNGMPFNNMVGLGGGRSKQFFVNQMDVQEIQLEMGGMAAENDTGGVQMNVVPKSGGNTFAGSGNFEFTNGDLQADNLTDELKARGLTTVTKLKKVYDYGGGFGGPIKKDKLWFYTAHRWWGSQELAADKFYNLNEGGPTLRARSEPPGVIRTSTSRTIRAASSGRRPTSKRIRSPWHKQHNCNCNLFIDFPDRSYRVHGRLHVLRHLAGPGDLGLSRHQSRVAPGRCHRTFTT